MHGKRKTRGITLIETMTATAIAAVTLGTAVPSFEDTLVRRALDGTAAQLASDLHYARFEAVARNQALRVGFETTAAGSCYVIHTGAAGDCSCAGAAAAACSNDAVELKTVRLAAGERVKLQSNSASMLFHPVRGTTTPAGTVRLVGSRGLEIRQVVSMMGRARSCSPGGLVKGYPACT